MEFPPPLNLEEERGLPAYVYLCINVHRHWYLSARHLSCSPRSFDYFNSCCGVNYSVFFWCFLGVCVCVCVCVGVGGVGGGGGGGGHIYLYIALCAYMYVVCIYFLTDASRLFASKFSILLPGYLSIILWRHITLSDTWSVENSGFFALVQS